MNVRRKTEEVKVVWGGRSGGEVKRAGGTLH